jgi:hypothetical protein
MTLENKLPLGCREDLLQGFGEGANYYLNKLFFNAELSSPSTLAEKYGRRLGKTAFGATCAGLLSFSIYLCN